MSNKKKTSNGINPRLIRSVIAIVAAIVLWFYINGSSIDLIEKDYANIPITVNGVESLNEKGLFAVDENVQYYVNLKLRGTDNNLKNISASTLSASIDLSEINTTGSHSLDIVIKGLPNSVILEEMKPATITINVEEYTEKEEKVKMIQNGQPAGGYQITSISTDEKVSLIGLPADLGKVNQVVATIPVMGLTADTIVTVKPQAYDENGNVIESLEIIPESIQVVIRVSPKTQ